MSRAWDRGTLGDTNLLAIEYSELKIGSHN